MSDCHSETCSVFHYLLTCWIYFHQLCSTFCAPSTKRSEGISCGISLAPAISSPRCSFAINYCSDLAPFSWEYLTFLTTSPNEWRKKRAPMGMNGVRKASPRVTSVRERLTKAVLCLLDLMAYFYSLRQLHSLTIHSTWKKFRVTRAAVWHNGKLMGNAVKYRPERRGSNMEERGR
jgi:hypothetical protein